MSLASSLSDERENGDAPYARSKLSPDLRYADSNGSSGRDSPARGYRNMGRHDDGSDSTLRDRPVSSLPQASNGVESWRRAAEVTSQLKARIEQMKVRKQSSSKHVNS